MSVANTGESDLGGQDVPLYLRDTAGDRSVPRGPSAATSPPARAARFEPGAETDVPGLASSPTARQGAGDLVFQPTEGYDPISWTGEVEEPSPVKPSGRGRGRG